MQAVAFRRFTGGNWTRAKVLEQLHYWQSTTTYKDETGAPVIIPRLIKLGALLRMHKGTVSKALKWLAEQGYILIRKLVIYGQPRLQIRLLVRERQHPRQQGGNTPGNTPATLYTPDTPENTPTIPPVPDRAGVTAMALKGPVSGVRDRLKQKQESVRARAREGKPRPKALALEWNRLLREYDYAPFDPDSKKHLGHIARTITKFGAGTIPRFLEMLEYRIGRWPDIRPKTLGKAPPHPWAINRTDDLIVDPQAIGYEIELAFTDEEKATLENPTVQEAVDMSVDKGDKGPSECAKPEPWKPGSKWIKKD